MFVDYFPTFVGPFFIQILHRPVYEAIPSIIAAYYWWSFPQAIGINPLEWAHLSQ